jgi:NitT/TauT family transport system substrate-binding protein
MLRQDEQGKAARAMAKLAGTTPEVFDSQLATTHLYADPKEAVEATSAPALITTMTRVRDSASPRGCSARARSRPTRWAWPFPAARRWAIPHVTLRFDESFMKMAADGKL